MHGRSRNTNCKLCRFQQRFVLWVGVIGAIVLSVYTNNVAPLLLIPLWLIAAWIANKLPLPQAHGIVVDMGGIDWKIREEIDE